MLLHAFPNHLSTIALSVIAVHVRSSQHACARIPKLSAFNFVSSKSWCTQVRATLIKPRDVKLIVAIMFLCCPLRPPFDVTPVPHFYIVGSLVQHLK
jgi:hypothetical protein